MDDHYAEYLQKISVNTMDVCRLCVNTKHNMKPLSEKPYIPALFEEVTKIEMSMSGKYPESICQECELNLQTSAAHIRNFSEVEQFWKNYLYNDHKDELPANHKSTEQMKLELADVYDQLNVQQPECAVDVFENITPQPTRTEFIINVVGEKNDIERVFVADLKAEKRSNSRKLNRNPKSEKFQCKLCGKNHTCSRNLEYHMEHLHNSMNGYICDYCQEKFLSKSQLRRHLKSHIDFECPACQKKFGTKARLSAHTRLHTRTAEDMVVCVPCNRKFIDKGTYKDHMRYSHTNLYEAKCPECDKVFKTPKRMRIHMLRHSKIKHLQCSECDKMFLQKQALIVHLRVHSGERPYVCDACGMAFKAMRSLQRHYRCHSDSNDGDTGMTKNVTPIQPFECPVCEKAFAHNTTLQKHLKSVHPGEALMQWQKMVSTICLKCNQIFPSLESIKHHQEQQHQNYQCDICKKYLNTEESFQYHVQAHSTKDRRFKCEVCGASFLKAATLRSHHRRAHSNERPFQCPTCQRRFVKNCDVTSHIRVVHNKEKPYVCNVCQKPYRSASLLKQHEQKHTGVYRYRCEACDRNFSNSQLYCLHNLRTHNAN